MAIYKNEEVEIKFGNLTKSKWIEVEVSPYMMWCPICESYDNGELEIVHGEDTIKTNCGCCIEDFLHTDDCYTTEDYNYLEAYKDKEINKLEAKVCGLEDEVEDLKLKIRDLENEIATRGQ